jgi:hypothetical protein
MRADSRGEGEQCCDGAEKWRWRSWALVDRATRRKVEGRQEGRKGGPGGVRKGKRSDEGRAGEGGGEGRAGDCEGNGRGRESRAP